MLRIGVTASAIIIMSAGFSGVAADTLQAAGGGNDAMSAGLARVAKAQAREAGGLSLEAAGVERITAHAAPIARSLGELGQEVLAAGSVLALRRGKQLSGGPATVPAIAYPVSDRLELSVTYWRIEAEDLALKTRQQAGLDPDLEGHQLILRAHWQF